MLNRIHLTIGVLAIVAMVSALALLDTVGDLGIAQNVASVLGVSSIAPASDDVDSDGLSNTDESYWQTDFQNPDTDGDGFLDGEETKSGHDPLIPGPNDLLMSQDNLTAKFADLTLAGLYEGTLGSQNPDNLNALNRLASIVAEDSHNNIYEQGDASVEFPSAGNSKTDQARFIQELAKKNRPFFEAYSDELLSFRDLLSRIESGGMADPTFVAYFEQKSEIMNASIESGLSIPVPSIWLPERKALLAIMRRLAAANYYVTQGKEDPIQATTALSAILTLAEQMNDLLAIYDKKIQQQGLVIE